MGCFSVPPTDQLPFNHRAFALAILYLPFVFPKWWDGWLLVIIQGSLQIHPRGAVFDHPHLKHSSSIFYPHFISFRAPVTCLCIPLVRCYCLSPLRIIEYKLHESRDFVKFTTISPVPETVPSTRQVCSQYLLNELTISDEKWNMQW